jgi:DHA2 family multidrug resistance protein-like MFS transporter
MTPPTQRGQLATFQPTERPERRWLILLVMCLSMLVLQIDNTVLYVALPAIGRDLAAGPEELQWIVASYLVAFSGLLLLAGNLSDRFGRRRLLMAGLAIFGLASLAATWATDTWALVAARALMGLGGALMMPSTMSILIVTFPGETERRKAMSLFAITSVFGLVGGPILGGYLTDQFTWTAIFWVNVPIVALALLAAGLFMNESTAPHRRFDPIGAALSLTGATALAAGIIALPRGGGILVFGSLCVAGATIVAFIVWELRRHEPMVPLELFRSRQFTGSCLSILLLQVALAGLLLVFTQYLQSVMGYSPTMAATALLPVVVAMILVQPVATIAGTRFGQRPVLVAGLLTLATGLAVLPLLGYRADFPALLAPLALFGAGAGLAQPAAMTVLTGAIPQRHAGIGSALNDTMLQFGSALGVAVLGSVLAATYGGRLPAGLPREAERSLDDAVKLSVTAGDPQIAELASVAFFEGVSVALWVSVAIVIVAAVVAQLTLRPGPQAATDEGNAP